MYDQLREKYFQPERQQVQPRTHGGGKYIALSRVREMGVVREEVPKEEKDG